MVQIKLSVAFILAVAAVAPVVALPAPGLYDFLYGMIYDYLHFDHSGGLAKVATPNATPVVAAQPHPYVFIWDYL